MDTSASKFQLCSFLLSVLIVCSSGSLHSIRHTVFMEPPITTNPMTTNPVTTPSTGGPTTTVTTNPVTTPSTGSPTTTVTNNPVTTPSTGGPTTTVTTNPVTTPSTGGPTTTVTNNPVTNPSTGGPTTTVPSAFPPPAPIPSTTVPPPSSPLTNPVTTPSTAIPQPATGTGTGTGGGGGQSWCVAKAGAPETTIQAALDYACGTGSADCSAIQQGGSCYTPNTLHNHASFAFNSYYQKNPAPTSCDFGGAATTTNLNPSSGSCIFPNGPTSSSASPTAMNPGTTTPIPTPTTDSSSGATPTSSVIPPALFNASSPALGGGISGYGESPMAANISWAFRPAKSQPLLGCVVTLTTIIITAAVLDV